MSNDRFREIQEISLKIAKFEYFAKQIIYIRNLQITCFKMIYNMFMFYEFDILRTPENGLNFDNFAKNKMAKSK